MMATFLPLQKPEKTCPYDPSPIISSNSISEGLISGREVSSPGFCRDVVAPFNQTFNQTFNRSPIRHSIRHSIIPSVNWFSSLLCVGESKGQEEEKDSEGRRGKGGERRQSCRNSVFMKTFVETSEVFFSFSLVFFSLPLSTTLKTPQRKGGGRQESHPSRAARRG